MVTRIPEQSGAALRFGRSASITFGLAVALAECCIQGGVGFSGELELPRRWDAVLFGEAQSRIVLSLAADSWRRLEELADGLNVPLRRLGVTGGDRFRLGPILDLPLADIDDAWSHSLERALAG